MNLIVIVGDCLRLSSRLPSANGYFGASGLSTALGDQFTPLQVMASSSWTRPSHDALLNGVLPWESRRPFDAEPRESSIRRSIAQVWREQGGDAVALAANPVIRGNSFALKDFTDLTPEPMGSLAHALLPAMLATDVARGEFRSPADDSIDDQTTLGAALIGLGADLLNRVTKRAFGHSGILAALGRYLKSRREGRPLLLFVNLYELHEPYPLPIRASADLSVHLKNLPTYNLSYYSGSVKSTQVHDALTAGYAHWAQTLERAILELLHLIEKYNLISNGLVAVTSDHGQSLGENGFIGHGHHLYNELIDVPLWMRAGNRVGFSFASQDLPHYPPDSLQVNSLLNDIAEAGLGPAVWKGWVERLSTSSGSLAFCEERRPLGASPDRRSSPYRILRMRKGGADVEVLDTSDGRRVISTTGKTAPQFDDLREYTLSTMQRITGSTRPLSTLSAPSMDTVSSWGYE
jgi:hypothetical protein